MDRVTNIVWKDSSDTVLKKFRYSYNTAEKGVSPIILAFMLTYSILICNDSKHGT